MKEKFNSISPFSQAIMLFLVGAVSLVIISMVMSIIIAGFYPEIANESTKSQIENYPIQYMLISFLPVQLGFLLTPGIVYIQLTKGTKSPVKQPKFKFILWGLLLFTVAFFLLPFISKLNFEALKLIGFYQELLEQKEFADKQLQTLIGNFGSNSYLTAVLLIGIVTGIAEELTFRRFLFHHILTNTKKLGLSLVVSAFIFALLHFNYFQILPLFTFGIVLAMIYHASGSILPGIFVHALNNIINIHWLATNNFPDWMDGIDLKITIPSTILLMGLIIYYKKN